MMKRKETIRMQCIRLNQTITDNPGKYALSDSDRQRIIERFFPAHPLCSKTKAYCSHCGGQVGVLTQKECPHCHKKWGKPERVDRPSRHSERAYLCVMNVIEGLQCMRFWCFEYHFKPGTPTNYQVREVERQFIRDDGHREGFAKGCVPMAPYVDAWSWDKDITIKPVNSKYSYYGSRIDARFDLPCEHTIIKSVIPILRRNGLKSSMHGSWHPVGIVRGLLTNPQVEWLWKIGQYEMATYVAGSRALNEEQMASVRICHRNHYRIEDPNLWLDHISLLQRLHLDTHNAKYVCPDPEKLRKDHEMLTQRLRRKQEKEAAERRAKRAAEKAKMRLNWSEHFAKILPLSLKGNNLTIRPLQSIDEFREEGKAMHHCVYDMEYYDYTRHPSSLILSAKDGEGKRLATIEYNTQKLAIVQCRAVLNAVPQRDKEIRTLIESHKADFQRLLAAA